MYSLPIEHNSYVLLSLLYWDFNAIKVLVSSKVEAKCESFCLHSNVPQQTQSCSLNNFNQLQQISKYDNLCVINAPNKLHLTPVLPDSTGKVRQVLYIRVLIRTNHRRATNDIRVIRTDIRSKIDSFFGVNFISCFF